MPRRHLHSRATDDELVEVYRENAGAVYAFFTYSVSHEHAEDLTAATFERVVRGWSRFNPDFAGPRTWILAIARNLLADHFRSRVHRSAVSLHEHPALVTSLGLQRGSGGAVPKRRNGARLA